ncbi:MAG: hypothetical protein Q9191_003605 [Dirinaria sp. TL-2023a]
MPSLSLYSALLLAGGSFLLGLHLWSIRLILQEQWSWAAVAVAFGGLCISRAHATEEESSIPSPRKTLLPHLSPPEIPNLAYPPEALPGGRDVDSPYGNLRVYEWGPPAGKKILFLHGISTPCIALGRSCSPLRMYVCAHLSSRQGGARTSKFWSSSDALWIIRRVVIL